MRHPTRHRGLLAAALLSTVLFRSAEARGQEFCEVFVDPESEIAVMSWDDLGRGYQLADAEKQLVVHVWPAAGELVSVEEGLAYVPHHPFWTAGGDSFVYSFADTETPLPLIPVLVLSPYGWLFAEDMETGVPQAWDSKVGMLRLVEDGIFGRSLEVVASAGEDRYLEVDLSAEKGGTNQNTDTKLTIDLEDPFHDPSQDRHREGDMLIWSVHGPTGIVTRLRLRYSDGQARLRAENGHEQGSFAETDWLPLAPSGASDVTIGVEPDGVLALEIETPGEAPRRSEVVDVNAGAVNFKGVHRLGAHDVTGDGEFRFLLDDFFAGRHVQADEIE